MTKSVDDIPYGWKRQKGELIQKDVEQWVIKRILAEICARKTLEEICCDLAKLGIKPKNGGLWFPRRIKKILDENEELHEKLTGTVVVSPPAPSVAQPSYQIPEKFIRPGAIAYEISALQLLADGSIAEGNQRSLEISKIVTHALLLVVDGKRETKQLLKGGSDEIQDRDLRSSKH